MLNKFLKNECSHCLILTVLYYVFLSDTFKNPNYYVSNLDCGITVIGTSDQLSSSFLHLEVDFKKK